MSVGLPVRNVADVVGRCIESVLSQDFADLELIICDNQSDDGTRDVVEDLARSDPRVSFSVNPVNIGLHENMKRTLSVARGTNFRWISADDWLEPSCLSTAVRTLDEHPDAVGVTNWFQIHTPDGGTRFEAYTGEYPEAQDPARRFQRMLWFFHAGDAKYDPVYGVYRREALLRSHPLRPNERTDWLLCAELALLGPIVHVPEVLAHRTREYGVQMDSVGFRSRLDPVKGEHLRASPQRLYRELFALAVNADLTPEQLRRCRRSLRLFWCKEVARAGRARAARTEHELRQRFGLLTSVRSGGSRQAIGL